MGSGINIFVPHHEVMRFQLGENYIYLALNFILSTNHEILRWKQHLFDILYFIHPGIIYLITFS